MDERSMLFVGVIIVVVTGALVWLSNRPTPYPGKRQLSGRSSLPPTRGSTTPIRAEKRRTASSPQDVTTASGAKATKPISQFNSHTPRLMNFDGQNK
jgi:hypothetical protein